MKQSAREPLPTRLPASQPATRPDTARDRKAALGWVAGQLAWERRLTTLRAQGRGGAVDRVQGRAGGARRTSGPVAHADGVPSAATAPPRQRPGAEDREVESAA